MESDTNKELAPPASGAEENIEYVSIVEYAALWSLGIEAVRKNCNRGVLSSAKKVNSRWVIDKKELPLKVMQQEKKAKQSVPKYCYLTEENNERLKACVANERRTSESDHINKALKDYFTTKKYL